MEEHRILNFPLSEVFPAFDMHGVANSDLKIKYLTYVETLGKELAKLLGGTLLFWNCPVTDSDHVVLTIQVDPTNRISLISHPKHGASWWLNLPPSHALSAPALVKEHYEKALVSACRNHENHAGAHELFRNQNLIGNDNMLFIAAFHHALFPYDDVTLYTEQRPVTVFEYSTTCFRGVTRF